MVIWVHLARGTVVAQPGSLRTDFGALIAQCAAPNGILTEILCNRTPVE